MFVLEKCRWLLIFPNTPHVHLIHQTHAKYFKSLCIFLICKVLLLSLGHRQININESTTRSVVFALEVFCDKRINWLILCFYLCKQSFTFLVIIICLVVRCMAFYSTFLRIIPFLSFGNTIITHPTTSPTIFLCRKSYIILFE